MCPNRKIFILISSFLFISAVTHQLRQTILWTTSRKYFVLKCVWTILAKWSENHSSWLANSFLVKPFYLTCILVSSPRCFQSRMPALISPPVQSSIESFRVCFILPSMYFNHPSEWSQARRPGQTNRSVFHWGHVSLGLLSEQTVRYSE